MNDSIYSNGFDRVAGIYDWCVKLVFGSDLFDLQNESLELIENCNSIAIVGGGTGRLLQRALKINLAERYYFIEKSKKMEAITRNSLSEGESLEVCFLWDINELPERVDALIFPFVLDCYTENDLIALIRLAQEKMKHSSQMVIADFDSEYTNNVWKKGLISALYLFFKAIVGTRPWRLPRIRTIIPNLGFKEVSRISKYNGWVFASVYESDYNNSNRIK